jgi:hypothetical protein
MITPDEFRRAMLDMDADAIVDGYLLSEGAAHVSVDGIEYVYATLSKSFLTQREDFKVYIVGSAKLGFSLVEKRTREGERLQRYRNFRAESDIDLAVISPFVFDQIWRELSEHAHKSVHSLPWDSGRLGDYLVHGWLRPDFFPKGVRLKKCDDWWDCMRLMSAEGKLGLRKVSGALYRSHEQLALYQKRAVVDCMKAEELRA